MEQCIIEQHATDRYIEGGPQINTAHGSDTNTKDGPPHGHAETNGSKHDAKENNETEGCLSENLETTETALGKNFLLQVETKIDDGDENRPEGTTAVVKNTFEKFDEGDGEEQVENHLGEKDNEDKADGQEKDNVNSNCDEKKEAFAPIIDNLELSQKIARKAVGTFSSGYRQVQLTRTYCTQCCTVM